MSLASPTRGPLVAVPLYRAPQLVEPLVAALAAMADEVAALDARILFVNDSPDDAGLAETLAAHFPAFAAACPAELIANDANLGFVRTANRALAMALAEGRDAILLNSDALPVPGAFAEMVAVAAADPTAGVVSPRSDNATICNSPYPQEMRPSPAAALAAHRLIEPHLPRATAVPTAVGFCLLIRHAMLARFGLFDEAYGGGYNEENDYIRRIGRSGFRALLANRAYVHHTGSVSFGASDEGRTLREIANRSILDRRYPEYGPAIDRWFEGPDYRAQRLLAGLVPDPDGRLRLTIDARDAGEAGVALAVALAEGHAARWRVRLLGPVAPGIDPISEAEARIVPAATALRIGAPRRLDDVVALGEMAPVTALLVTDAAALDRAVLEEDPASVGALWQAAADTASLFAFADAAVEARTRAEIGVPEAAIVAPDARALAAAFDEALAALDYGALKRRQARLALLADHGRARRRGALAATGAGARADALIADFAREAVLASALAAWAATPPSGGKATAIDLRPAGDDTDAMLDRLLDAPPGPLRLHMTRAGARAAATPLAAVGRAVSRIRRGWRGAIVEVTAARDWRALLPGPADDEAFVDLACLALLGRRPEAEEQAAMAETVRLHGRDALLRAIQRSPARRGVAAGG